MNIILKKITILLFSFLIILIFAGCRSEGKTEATEIFDSLSLNDKDAYNKNKNIVKDVNKYKVDLISNDAGTGVYIYKASE